MAEKKTIKAAAVQFNHQAGRKQENLRIMKEYVTRAAANGVEILAFPEMCITGYWHVRNLTREEILELAEEVPAGPSTQAIARLSASSGMIIGAGLTERSQEGGIYNSYPVCLPDGRVFCHRKLHTFISDHFSCGDRYTVFDTPLGVRLGVLTCYDNNIIENARITALMGADILLAPHQTGGCDSRSPHAMGLIDPRLWDNREKDPGAIEREICGPKGREWILRWLPARAHDNGMFLVFSNGVGPDDGEVRTGNAMILDPYGRIITETCRAGNDMVVADLDLSLLDNCSGRRWMRGRRPELYGELLRKNGQVSPGEARFS
jgi:predicted amidohydrolase